MRREAPRLPWRLWRGFARGACLALSLWLVLPGAGVEAREADAVVAARYAEPTTRYDHAILGDAVEWGALVLTVAPCAECPRRERMLRLPESRVFEDLAPRLMSDGAGGTLAMVVESDRARGARLALYDAAGLVTATPFIGQTHRWLAPVGAGDLDGDGRIEIAYVDRPHLARILKVWRLEGRVLVPVAEMAGLSNHRIGWDFIPGGLRDCGAGPEMVVASADWTRVMAVTLRGGRLDAREVGVYRGPQDLAAALACG